MGDIHSFGPGLRVVCGLGPEKNCPAAYTNINSFKSHVYKKHRNLLFPAIQRGIRDSNEAGEGGVAPGLDDVVMDEVMEHDHEAHSAVGYEDPKG